MRMIQGGRTLRETIATEASQQVELVRNPNAELVWGVVPKSAELPEDLSLLFKRTAVVGPQSPRYQRWFWTAFIKPIRPHCKRYISDGAFADIPELEREPAGAIPVLESDIVDSPSEVPDDYARVQKSILKWAARTGISVERFYLGATAQRVESRAASFPSEKFAALDIDDLKRIMVPLDVVLKLMRRP